MSLSVVSKIQVLSIYKTLLRESQKFSSYNFRSYALRRIHDAFKANKSLVEPKEISKQFNFAKDNLEVIKRQVIVSQLYGTEKLVIENQ